MKKMLIAIVLMAIPFGMSKGQSNIQIGANIGSVMGVSLKYYMNSANAIEGVMGYQISKNGPSFKFMYQYSIPLVENLSFYLGAGAHFGEYHVNKRHDGKFAFGVVPTIGFELPISSAPITLGFGYEPALNFTTNNSWEDVAFKVRFRF